MAGSKELKIASEAMEQIKVHRALFQEALMWPPPQKRLRTVPRGSTYQGKLSSFIGSQCCLLLSLHWSINKKKLPAKMQSRLRKKLLPVDLKMVQKFDSQNGCRASKLISLSCIWKLGMTAKTGSKNNTKMRATWKRTFDSWVRPASSYRTRRGGGSVRNLLRRAPHPCRHVRKKFCWILTVPRNGRMSFTRAFKSIVYRILCKQTAISFLRDGAAPMKVKQFNINSFSRSGTVTLRNCQVTDTKPCFLAPKMGSLLCPFAPPSFS